MGTLQCPRQPLRQSSECLCEFPSLSTEARRGNHRATHQCALCRSGITLCPREPCGRRTRTRVCLAGAQLCPALALSSRRMWPFLQKTEYTSSPPTHSAVVGGPFSLPSAVFHVPCAPAPGWGLGAETPPLTFPQPQARSSACAPCRGCVFRGLGAIVCIKCSERSVGHPLEDVQRPCPPPPASLLHPGRQTSFVLRGTARLSPCRGTDRAPSSALPQISACGAARTRPPALSGVQALAGLSSVPGCPLWVGGRGPQAGPLCWQRRHLLARSLAHRPSLCGCGPCRLSPAGSTQLPAF